MPKGAPVLPETLSRFDTLGPDSLSDAELLALAFNISEAAAASGLTKLGGLFRLARASPANIAEALKGGRARARSMVAVRELGLRMQAVPLKQPLLRTPDAIAAYLRPRIGSLSYEVFHVLCFDARNRLICDVRVATGTAAACSVDPRRVFAPALTVSGTAAIVVAHNHPSGVADPSAQDRNLTEYICSGARALQVSVLDHVIVASKDHYSFMANGIMPLSATPHPSQG